jgi:urease accessory protein
MEIGRVYMVKRFGLAAILAVLAASPALAHVGHGVAGLAAGLSHPMGGWDHLVPMIAVGLWASVIGGRALWLLPLTFVAVMVAGAGFGLAGFQLPYAELLVLASVITLSGMALLKLRLNLALSASIAAIFALAHGQLHGGEMPLDVSGAAYFAGFALATAALHGVGLVAGHYLTSKTQVRAPRTTS